MKLRDYQQKAVEAVLAAWLKYKSCVVVLPTGCGKTVVFGEVIRRILPKRAMVLAHREELIRQARDKVGALTGADVQVEMGAFEVSDMFGRPPDVVVSTVQTQCTGRMGKFAPDDFGALVVDEAHHATSMSYRRCIDHYMANPDCRLLGVTATPDRADEKALGAVFETVAFEYPMTDAIRDGWLVPVRQKLVKVGQLDYSAISTTAGDFNQGELAEVLEEEQNLQSVAAPTVEICGARRAIVFAVSVKQAERLCEILNRYRPDSAKWICGKTDRETRAQTLKDFADGRVQYVVNVGVLTEGFDDAGVEVVVMARPTKSRALYAQMAGRATRPAAAIADKLGLTDEPEKRRAIIAASEKPCCLIVDFVGNSGRHKLVTTLDILGGKNLDDETADLARRKIMSAADEAQLDTAEALEEARKEIEARRLDDEKARKFIVASAKYTAFPVDPFDVFDLAPADRLPKASSWTRLSYRQRAILREKMRINPDSLTPAQGKALIDEYFRRVKGHLATFGQARFLRRHGIPVPMSFDEASKTIGRLMK